MHQWRSQGRIFWGEGKKGVTKGRKGQKSVARMGELERVWSLEGNHGVN